jgi:hypothetical protein
MAMKDAKFFTGYGGPEVDIALMRGEIDARASAAETTLQRNTDWIDKGLVDFQLMLEVPNGSKLAHFAAPPGFDDFAKSDREQKLLGLCRTFRMVGTPGTPRRKCRSFKTRCAVLSTIRVFTRSLRSSPAAKRRR